jgi:hypothetical protein
VRIAGLHPGCCCGEVETEIGNLIVYVTIIGIYGNRHVNIKKDIEKQLKDFKNLSENNEFVCIAGDFNISFLDNYYYTKFGREELKKSLEERLDAQAPPLSKSNNSTMLS